jgi:hypothetical protein
MARRPMIHYTDSQKAQMWERWQRGESLNKIAQLFDRHHSSVQNILAATGGIRPAARRRSSRALTLAEREEISRGIVAGRSMRSIAAGIGRAPSTISRELGRNQGLSRYRASMADQAAWDRAKRPKACKLGLQRSLARQVAHLLQMQWSPQQVSGWLKRAHPDDLDKRVSHETIYRTLYIQSRGALKKELLEHLRRPRGMRRSRHHTQKTADHGRIGNRGRKQGSECTFLNHLSESGSECTFSAFRVVCLTRQYEPGSRDVPAGVRSLHEGSRCSGHVGAASWDCTLNTFPGRNLKPKRSARSESFAGSSCLTKRSKAWRSIISQSPAREDTNTRRSSHGRRRNRRGISW